MLSGLYIKLIASAIVLAVVAGGYLYVRGLQTQVQQLYTDNSNLKISNKELKDSLAAEVQMNQNIAKISQAGDKQREINKQEYNQQIQKIDNKVKTGKDRKVGPLLEEFFNDK
jgi:regulator of replication initiation timing